MVSRHKWKRKAQKTPKKSEDAIFEWILKPFEKKIGWLGLAKRWLLFIFLGFVAMGIVQAFGKYDFSEADTLTAEGGQGCDMLAMALLLLLPPVEELLFRIAPHHFFGKDASFIGSLAWSFLHLFGRNFAIVAFQLVVGIFYFKLVASKRYKEVILFHEAFNLVPLITCFLF